MNDQRRPPAAEAEKTDQSPRQVRTQVSSEELLRGRKELFIEHEGEIYRLRLTSRGKLILTK